MGRHSDIFDRQFDLDPSCKLWMPFYKYGLEVGAKFPDYSGNNNHGTITGAVPATYPVLSGVNKVINGTFSGDTDWTKGTGWAITTVATKTAGVASDLEQDINVTASKRYRLLYTLTRTAGSITSQIGSTDGTARSASGIYEDIIIATDTGNLKFQADATFAGTVDVVSCQEVVGYEGLGWNFDIVDDRVVHPSLNLGTSHTLHYWIKKYPGNTGVVHGGAANYHGLRVTDTLAGYNVGTTEVTVNHGLTWVQLQQNKNLFSVVRSGTSVDFYLNGSQIGTTQTLLANNALIVTDIGRYSDGTYYFGNNIFEVVNFNNNKSAQEIRNYYELTRHIFGA